MDPILWRVQSEGLGMDTSKDGISYSVGRKSYIQKPKEKAAIEIQQGKQRPITGILRALKPLKDVSK